jgi:hypothetical protein
MYAPKNKSLSAETELNSAYDFLYQGEYKQCMRIIKKKMPKLKSAVDKAYFNILKLRVLKKTKQTKEEKELLSQLIKEFSENEELLSDESVTNYFKNFLRSNDEQKAAMDIFNIQLKKKDLNSISEKGQRDILKELCLGMNFKDIYSKCNTFLKQKNLTHEKYLILLKHEAVYYLYKNKKLPEGMTKKIFDEFVKNIELYRDQTGYFDIVAQFSEIFNDEEKLINILSQKKKEELIHVPLDDIKLDKLYKEKKFDEIIKILFNKIKENPEKCLFNDYERLINLIFASCEEKKVKIKFEKINENITADDINKELPSLEKDPNELVKRILELFENIKKTTGAKIINSFKSGVLGQLMICHNIIMCNEQFDELIHSYMKTQIINLLDKCIRKQAILFEISKYFIYLNEADRNEIILKFKPEKVDENKFDELNAENLEHFLFYLKLRKCLNMDKDKQISDIIMFIFKAYLFVRKNITKNTKLEKGERGLGDDLIILANEYYYEKFGEEKNGKKLIDKPLALILMCMNIYSRNKSPYNYDISYYLAKTYGYLIMNQDALDTIIYMNLKGPQNDTISYFLFNYFVNYPQGLNSLINHSEGWQLENRKQSNKTFWKLIDNGNFWKTQELIDFLELNNLSYYDYLLQFYEIVLGLNDALFNKDGVDAEKEKNHYEVIEKFYQKILPLMDKFVKNQDILFLLHKYDGDNYLYFDNKYNELKKNKNYKETNYRFILDSLNKKNNCLYESYPGYKNNYFEHKSVSPFGEYDNMNCLLMRVLSLLLISKLKIDNKDIDIKSIEELNEKYKKTSDEIKNTLDINLSSLIDVFINSLKDAKYLVTNKDKIIELYSHFNEVVVNKINELRKNLKFQNLEELIKLNEIFNKNKYFYIFLYGNITSKLLEIIADHKKESNDIGNMKTKLNEIFKTPLINCLRDLQNKIDELLKERDNLSNKEVIWDYENDIKLYFKDYTLEDEVTTEFKSFANKLKVKHAELFEGMKKSSKFVIDYIKQIL